MKTSREICPPEAEVGSSNLPECAIYQDDSDAAPRNAPTKDALGELSPSTIARFWEKVDRRNPDECWPWLGGAGAQGHGRFKIGGRLVSAHRVSFALANGPIPARTGYHGTVIRHLCDNPKCVNPAHLQSGSQSDNMRDAAAAGACGLRKLTHNDAAEIRASEEKARALADRYSVTPWTIHKIKRGVRWSVAAPVAD